MVYFQDICHDLFVISGNTDSFIYTLFYFYEYMVPLEHILHHHLFLMLYVMHVTEIPEKVTASFKISMSTKYNFLIVYFIKSLNKGRYTCRTILSQLIFNCNTLVSLHLNYLKNYLHSFFEISFCCRLKQKHFKPGRYLIYDTHHILDQIPG